jgi:ABC-type Fe3+/spermidine/putrescine transport system ATPase subunit
MSVAQNIAYGLRRRKISRAETQQRVAELLELVSLPGFGERSVTRLSGGEQQRVAIARALAPKPRLLLLDEPLSALDEKIRREMQTQLKDIQRATKTTFVYVTHDQEEALTMSDRVAVLNRGRLVQVDEPHKLFRSPRTRFVAGFFRGSNVVTGDLINGPTGMLFRCASFQVELLTAPVDAADPPSVAIRAEDIRIDDAANSDDLTFEATLDRIIYRGVYTDYQVRLADGQVIVASSTGVREVAPGKTVRLAIRADLITPLSAEPMEAGRLYPTASPTSSTIR